MDILAKNMPWFDCICRFGFGKGFIATLISCGYSRRTAEQMLIHWRYSENDTVIGMFDLYINDEE